MAHARTHITRTTVHRSDADPDNMAATTRTDDSVEEAPASCSVLATRIVSYLLGVLEVILAFRFVLALLGANRGSGFGQFVFGLSYPFVQPFFGLFGYTPQYGSSHLELYTLVAMAVYAIVAWGIIALIRLPRRGDDV